MLCYVMLCYVMLCYAMLSYGPFNLTLWYYQYNNIKIHYIRQRGKFDNYVFNGIAMQLFVFHYV